MKTTMCTSPCKALLRPLLIVSLLLSSAATHAEYYENINSADDLKTDKIPDKYDMSVAYGWRERGRLLRKKGFDRKGWWILGVGAAATVLAVPFDKSAPAEIDLKPETAEFGSKLGGGVPTGVTAMLQLAFDFDNGVAHTEALFYTSLSHNVIKYLFQRRRPDRGQRESFPSGHAANVFAAATSLSYAYGPYIGVPSYILATIVGLARLNDGVHFTSDVVAGAALGIFWGHATRASHPNEMKPYFDLRRGVIGWEWNY